jgi:SulP family sulfate permease
VIIDLTDAHVWDCSADAVLDTIVAEFERHGTETEIVGLNTASATLHGRMSGFPSPGN